MSLDMRTLLGALALLSEGQRRAIVRARLELLADATEQERASELAELIALLGALGHGDARKLLASRAEVLAELPETQRTRLVRTYGGLLRHLPAEHVRAERDAMADIAVELSPPGQAVVRELLRHLTARSGGAARRAS